MTTKTVTASFFEVKVQGTRINEQNVQKKVTDQYVFDAMSFTEAEAAALEKASLFYDGNEIDVTAIAIAPYKDIILVEDDNSQDKWYKVKVAYITISEITGKEQKTYTYYLVSGSTFDDAKDNIDSALSNTMLEYSVESISLTKNIDIFFHE